VRCVDDRKELLEVVDEEAIEERLVPVLERGEADISLEVIALSADVLKLERHLVLDDRHPGRQQPSEAEGPPFGVGEGRSLVEQTLGNDILAP